MASTRLLSSYFILSLILAFVPIQKAMGEPVSRLRLELELVDGSRLFGEPVEANPKIGLRSRAGHVDVWLNELSQVEVKQDKETVAIQWPNGDRLTGISTTAGFEVNTVLGKINVPLATLRRCTVQVLAAGKAIKPTGVSASGSYSRQVAGNAIDGNPTTNWSSGAYRGWIELDLGATYEMASVGAVLQFYPKGFGSHAFYISDKPMQGNVSGGKLIKTFSGTRRTNDVLKVACGPGIVGRYVQLRCARSVAWFNVVNIEVMPKL